MPSPSSNQQAHAPSFDSTLPVNDLPVTFPNSIAMPGETIRIPTDVSAQWDMAAWAKSRGGVLMADRHGPAYVAGGDLTQTANTFNFSVAPCEAWPLEEVIQEERVALRVLSPATQVNVGGSTGPSLSLIGMAVTRDTGMIGVYPITLPSVERDATYMEVTNVANTIVPLWAIMADPTRGAGYAELHDLRLPPFQLVGQDRNGNKASGDWHEPFLLPCDQPGGWSILRNYRLWIYAPVGSLFEVVGAATHVRPYDMRPTQASNPFFLSNSQDLTVERKLSFYINGQIASSLDKTSGLEVVSGLSEATTNANQFNPKIVSAVQPIMIRTVFRSLANAIHDVCLAAFIAEGSKYQYGAHVTQPQLWARMIAAQPQFELKDSGASGTSV